MWDEKFPNTAHLLPGRACPKSRPPSFRPAAACAPPSAGCPVPARHRQYRSPPVPDLLPHPRPLALSPARHQAPFPNCCRLPVNPRATAVPTKLACCYRPAADLFLAVALVYRGRHEPRPNRWNNCTPRQVWGGRRRPNPPMFLHCCVLGRPAATSAEQSISPLAPPILFLFLLPPCSSVFLARESRHAAAAPLTPPVRCWPSSRLRAGWAPDRDHAGA
jgi:hypothetical protein